MMKYRDKGATYHGHLGMAPEFHESQYRYLLWREWGDMFCTAATVLWILHNPSTASGFDDDPTVRRCVRFASLWGCNRIEIVNRYAYRATNPDVIDILKRDGRDPMGPENARFIREAIDQHPRFIVCAWGSGCPDPDDDEGIAEDGVLRELWANGGRVHALGLNANGSPKHPLYVPYETHPYHATHYGDLSPPTVAELRRMRSIQFDPEGHKHPYWKSIGC